MDIEHFMKQHASILKGWSNASGTETFIQLLEIYKKEWSDNIQKIAYESFNGNEFYEKQGIASIRQTIAFLQIIDRIIALINELKIYEQKKPESI